MPHVHAWSGSIFAPKQFIIVSIQVQFILNEINLSYFLTPNILIKSCPWESLDVRYPENREKIRLSQNSTKIFWITRFRETNPLVKFFLSSEI